MVTIRKELLEKYRFSDHPNAWLLEAEGYRHSAELLMLGMRNMPRPKFISAVEANRNQQCLKHVCFLYSISIELFLKAIYSAARTPEDIKATETFGHDLHGLSRALVAKDIFKEDELDTEMLALAHIILAWFGRYHRPRIDNIEKVINTYFEEVPEQPGMLKPKFTINHEATIKLELMAALLSNKMPANTSSLDAILFTPF